MISFLVLSIEAFFSCLFPHQILPLMAPLQSELHIALGKKVIAVAADLDAVRRENEQLQI